MCFDLNYTSREELEAVAEMYDNVVAGTHERVQAAALEWMKNFKNPNDEKKHYSKRYQTFVERM
jgi:hypothetical protein